VTCEREKERELKRSRKNGDFLIFHKNPWKYNVMIYVSVITVSSEIIKQRNVPAAGVVTHSLCVPEKRHSERRTSPAALKYFFQRLFSVVATEVCGYSWVIYIVVVYSFWFDQKWTITN
jgi:hypothetical protein